MFVSNKYDLGDEVYFINDENTPCKSQVLSVNIYVDADGTEIEYEVSLTMKMNCIPTSMT